MQNIILSQLVKTKQQLSYENIKAAIVQGEYKPGEKLVVGTIARKLGVSNIPVREALKKLESEGLVQNTPHLSPVVAVPDFKNHAEIFATRQLLEGQVTLLAAQNMPPKILKKLKKILEEMKRACDTDAIKVADLNHQFHDLIFASCGNAILYKLIQQLWPICPRAKFIFPLVPSMIPVSVKEHEEIYSLLEARDPEGAKQAFLKHKQSCYDLLMKYSAELAT
jgi:DNA-binding GntR family transcriptional regulator